MEFNAENKVIVETLNKEEAKAFIKFLVSERKRHQRDIDDIYDLIIFVGSKFQIPVFGD